MTKDIKKLGKYARPEDSTKPYYVEIHWFDGKPPVNQPLTEQQFFQLLSEIVEKYKPTLDVVVG